MHRFVCPTDSQTPQEPIHDMCRLEGPANEGRERETVWDRCNVTMHTEGEPHSALPDALVFQEARRWIDKSHDDASRPANIEEILKNLLQDMRRCQTARSIKSIMVLTALTQFVKLCTSLRHHPRCRTPVTTASLMVSMC